MGTARGNRNILEILREQRRLRAPKETKKERDRGRRERESKEFGDGEVGETARS